MKKFTYRKFEKFFWVGSVKRPNMQWNFFSSIFLTLFHAKKKKNKSKNNNNKASFRTFDRCWRSKNLLTDTIGYRNLRICTPERNLDFLLGLLRLFLEIKKFKILDVASWVVFLIKYSTCLELFYRNRLFWWIDNHWFSSWQLLSNGLQKLWLLRYVENIHQCQNIAP